jgi:hypothetical protein
MAKFDPAVGAWTSVTNGVGSKQNHVMTARDPALYALGTKFDGQAVTAFDVDTGTAFGRTSSPTALGHAPGIESGTVAYIFGGGRDNTTSYAVRNNVMAYDMATNTWATKASMPTPRKNAAAVQIDGYVYVVGGENAANTPLAVNERYSLSGNTWA